MAKGTRYFWDGAKLAEIRPGDVIPRSAAVIGDSMPPVTHHCDGQIYDSKSAFRKTTKHFGCEEMGNDQRKEAGPTMDLGTKEAVRRSYEEWESKNR